MATVLRCGYLVQADESMSAYTDYGSERQKGTDIPSLDVVKRKPEPVGKELKDAADALSGAIFLLEIMRPASDHASQEFADRFSYTSALNLRLTKPLHEVAPNRGRRIYVADAHFGSVDDAEIMALHGMHSILTVKGHTRRFPAKPLADHCGPNASDWAAMRTLIGRDPSNPVYIYAIGHRRGKEAAGNHSYASPPFCRCTRSSRHAARRSRAWRSDTRRSARQRRAWPSPQVPGASSSARGAPSKRRPAASPYSPGERRSPRVCSGQHSLMLIRDVVGWQGGGNARCSVCNDPSTTRWCCAKCSNADRILALHAETCGHGPRVTQRMCVHHHRQAPHKAGVEHKWCHASLSKQVPKGTKRRR